ncbi:MAG: MATE family efflux transporter [Vicinamibacteraceae bacterium]
MSTAVPTTPRAATSWRQEFRPLGRLAWPVILAEIGWMAMGIVDTLMVGPLGPEAIGGVGLAGILFFALAACGMGVLLGLDTVVSQAHGAGDHEACRRWWWQGLWLGLGATPPLAGLLWLQRALLPHFGFNPGIIAIVHGNLDVLWLSLLPLFVYAASRRYLQAIGLVRPVMVALIAANIVNAIANWALIYGRLGLPALGTDGAAWATFVARVIMAIVPVAAIFWHDLRHHTGTPVWRVPKWPAAADLATLLRLGVPAMLQMVFEVGGFAVASSMAASQRPAAIAAHQVSLELAGLAFMVPLGIASAAAVRVGHAVGRRDGPGAEHAGWAAILLGTAAMTTTALAFVTLPRLLIGLFTRDPDVVRTGTWLLGVGAVFAVFDGVQVVATGALRGLGETRRPMIWNLVAYWGLGLPIGWALAFVAGWGVVGIWVGLSTSLIVVGTALTWTWARAARDWRLHCGV